MTSGKRHTSVHAKHRQGCLLDELGARYPVLMQGDCGYGNEGILTELESRNQPYLLRLRQTRNMQRLVARQFARSGWSRRRRVAIVRQRIRPGLVRKRVNDRGQLRLTFADPAVLGPDWWNWCCRAAHPCARPEAITSYPLLLAAVGKAASHTGQIMLYLTPLHGRASTTKVLIANVHAALVASRQ